MTTTFCLDKCEQALVQRYANDKRVKVCRLDVGDVLFSVNDKPWLCIERKTVSDLIASLGDKRYHEQKIRLQAYKHQNPGVHVLYLVEGLKLNNEQDYVLHPNSRKTFPKSTIVSIITKLMFRDGFLTHVTQNIQETGWFLDKIYTNLLKKEFGFTTAATTATAATDNVTAATNYLKHVKMAKKENITPGIFCQLSLSQIPGISPQKAQCVTQRYATIPQLLSAYESCTSIKECENLLRHVKVNGRNLGPAASKKIYTFIMGSNE